MLYVYGILLLPAKSVPQLAFPTPLQDWASGFGGRIPFPTVQVGVPALGVTDIRTVSRVDPHIGVQAASKGHVALVPVIQESVPLYVHAPGGVLQDST